LTPLTCVWCGGRLWSRRVHWSSDCVFYIFTYCLNILTREPHYKHDEKWWHGCWERESGRVCTPWNKLKTHNTVSGWNNLMSFIFFDVLKNVNW
jgi:hypothetical protein